MIYEEKAFELAEAYCKNYASENVLEEDKDLFSSFPECKKVAMLMSEWKDRQFKEYLEKKKIQCQEKKKPYGIYDYRRGHIEHQERLIDKIIKELFEGEQLMKYNLTRTTIHTEYAKVEAASHEEAISKAKELDEASWQEDENAAILESWEYEAEVSEE